MSINYKQINCLLFFLLFSWLSLATTNAQADSLVLFTKEGCSNCNYAKSELIKHGIGFKEYKLENKINGSRMLRQLHAYDYYQSVTLPGIFLNSEVLHPIAVNDTGIERISLQDAVNNIIYLNSTGAINLIQYQNKSKTDTADIYLEGDCELELIKIFVVVKNFKQKESALLFLRKLKSEGYTEAGYIAYKKLFRVYSALLINGTEEEANDELKVMRKEYKQSYLLKIP